MKNIANAEREIKGLKPYYMRESATGYFNGAMTIYAAVTQDLEIDSLTVVDDNIITSLIPVLKNLSFSLELHLKVYLYKMGVSYNHRTYDLLK